MMKNIYKIDSRRALVCGAVFFSLIGLWFLPPCIWAFESLVANDKIKPGDAYNIFFAFVFLPAGFFCGRCAWRLIDQFPHTVVLAEDGRIEIRRVLRSTRIKSNEINYIEKAGEPGDSQREIADTRELRIVHAGGTVRLTAFDGIGEFISETLKRNRSVEMRGTWSTAK